jgi:hypothetical protein
MCHTHPHLHVPAQVLLDLTTFADYFIIVLKAIPLFPSPVCVVPGRAQGHVQGNASHKVSEGSEQWSTRQSLGQFVPRENVAHPLHPPFPLQVLPDFATFADFLTIVLKASPLLLFPAFMCQGMVKARFKECFSSVLKGGFRTMVNLVVEFRAIEAKRECFTPIPTCHFLCRRCRTSPPSPTTSSSC